MRQLYWFVMIILLLLIETANAKEVQDENIMGAIVLGFNKEDIKDYNSSDKNKSFYKKLKAHIVEHPTLGGVTEIFDSSDINQSVNNSNDENKSFSNWIKDFFGH